MIEQEDRPGRKVYHITDEGLAELHRWLTTSLDLPKIRHKGLVQVFFAHQLSDEESVALFEVHVEKLRHRSTLLPGKWGTPCRRAESFGGIYAPAFSVKCQDSICHHV